MKTKRKRTIRDEIDHVLRHMENMDVTSVDYARVAIHLKSLYEAKGSDAGSRVTPDTWVLVGANILGILLILNYEKFNVISSKTLGLLMRGRI